MILFIIIFLNHFGHADQWDSIFKAQNEWDLIQAEKRLNSIDKYELICEFELKKSLFPFNCFQFLDKSLERPQALERVRVLQQKLNHLCLQRADKIKTLSQLQTLESHPWVDSSCKKELSRRKQDLEYILGKSHRIGPDIEKSLNHGSKIRESKLL